MAMAMAMPMSMSKSTFSHRSNLTWITWIKKTGVRANSSISKVPIDWRPRNSRPSDRFTLFTGPKATKKAVIRKIAGHVHAGKIDLSGQGTDDRAAVILASPRHASWLDDKSFMADLVSTLEKPSAPGLSAAAPSFHVVAAVVDGLSPRVPSREPQEGLSIYLGLRKSLLPDLWTETSPKDAQPTQPQRADVEESSTLSILLPQRLRDKAANIALTLPLAITLFETGRRSTLLVSEWARTRGPSESSFELVRMAQKRTQVIKLPPTVSNHKVNIRAPLAPITHPRKVLEGLGNILAKIEINGEPSPASKELQVNIPRLLQARGALSQSDFAAERVGVWALVYPKHMFLGDNLVRFNRVIGGRFLGTAQGKLVFELSTDPERVAWETQPTITNAVFQGARLHRILSGGGEWGTKASLLSLDPQTSHGRESEEDELDKFIKSFNRDDDAKDAIAKPGDFVQFFVERDPLQLAQEYKENIYISATVYPPVSFGVGDTNLKDIEPPDKSVESRRPVHPENMYWIASDHFGGYSAEGIYLTTGDVGPNTKLDVPGAHVNMSSAAGAVNAPYRSMKSVYKHKKDTV